MSQEYRSLALFVHRVQQNFYRRRVLQSGIVVLTIMLTLLLLGVGIQQIVPVLPLLAFVYSLGVIGVLLWLGYALILPGLRRVSARRALSEIEKTYPDLHDDLTNAIQLNPVALEAHNPHGVALDLVQALHRRTARRVTAYEVTEVARQQPLTGRSWCALVAAATVVIGLWQPGMLGESLRMVVQPLSYLPARDIHLVITPERAVIAAGTNLEVLTQVQGQVPKSVDIVVKRQGQPDKRYTMEPHGQGTFRYTFLKPQTSLTFQAMAGSTTSAVGSLDVMPAPAIGHVALYYVFPEYTELPPRTQEGGGDIQALPGTQVQLSMRANVSLSKGRLRFESGQEVPLVVNGQELRGNMLVMQEGAYTVEIEDTHGLKNPQPPRYTVHLVADLAPKVELRQPQDGLEIDEMGSLQVRYDAEDDFGLQDAALVFFGAGAAEQRVSLHKGHFEKRQEQETFTWDLNQWTLPPTEAVQVYVEVYDNDTISGPKKGVSPTITLKLRSREHEHQALENLQKEVAHEVLELLAEHLELAEQMRQWREQLAAGKPAPDQEALQQAREKQQQAMQRAERLAEQIDEALTRTQQDPYSTYESFADMQALQRNMAHLQNALMPPLQRSLQGLTPQTTAPEQLAQPERHVEDVVQELERLSALAEQIASGERMQDLMRLSNKMLDQQNKLLSALDNLPKDFQGGELPPELQKMLDTLDALMQQLMQAVSQLPTTMPDEFLNRQLDNLPLNDLQKQLQEMRQKLAEGDLEGARKMAEELLKNLSAMVASLQNMGQQARGGSMSPLAQQLQESTDRLTELVQRQEKVLDETQQIDQATLQELNQAQQKAFDIAQKRVEQELNELFKVTSELSRRARQNPEVDAAWQDTYQQALKQLHAARKNLQSHDIPQVRRDLEEAEMQMAGMQEQSERFARQDPGMQQQFGRARQHLQAAQQALENLPQDRQAMLSPQQRQQLGHLGGQQGGIRHDTESLAQEITDLLPLMPFLPAEIGEHLQEALPFMDNAQGELAGQRSQPAIPPEQDALERLRHAQNSMQQAMQAMMQRGQMMGMSMPMLRQAGRFPMPNGMPQPQVDEQQGGAAGASVRNFQLPDKEAYKVPRLLREDITDALKEGYPERYKDAIEQYYRHIVR